MICTDRFANAPMLYSLCDTDDDNVYCSGCGDVIDTSEEHYDINGVCFCMDCEADAEDEIIRVERSSYITRDR